MQRTAFRLVVAAVTALALGGVATSAVAAPPATPGKPAATGKPATAGKPANPGKSATAGTKGHQGKATTKGKKIKGLCTAFSKGGAKKLTNKSFKVLVTAAGSESDVKTFCATVLKNKAKGKSATAGSNGKGKATGKAAGKGKSATAGSNSKAAAN